MEAQLSSEEPQQQPPIEILLPVQNHADTLVEPPMQVRGAALLHSLQKQARRRRTIFYSICVPIFATALLLAPMYASDAPRLSAIVTLGMLWSLIGLGLICVRPSRGQMEAIKRLGLTDSLEAIPALLDSEAYVTLGPDGRNVKRAALIALLQRLKASDRSLLSDKHLGRLYYDLSVAEQLLSPSWGKRNSAEEYLLAILKALEQVGDHRAIKYVERVANMKAKAPAAIRVRDAASECLPALKQRLESSGDILLRAASDVENKETVLLRPASSTMNSNSEPLLRPIEQRKTMRVPQV